MKIKLLLVDELTLKSESGFLDSPSTSGGLKKSTPHTMSTLHEEQHSESENESDKDKTRQHKSNKDCKVQVEMQLPKNDDKKVVSAEQQVLLLFDTIIICFLLMINKILKRSEFNFHTIKKRIVSHC